MADTLKDALAAIADLRAQLAQINQPRDYQADIDDLLMQFHMQPGPPDLSLYRLKTDPIPAPSSVIEEIVVGTPVSSVTFSDIPQTFKSLKLLVTGGDTGGANDPLIILAINGDNATGNYATNYLGSNNAGNFVGPGALPGFAGAVIGNFNGAGDSSRIIMQLPHYAEPDFIKMGTVAAMTTGWGFRTAAWNFKWNSSASVTSLEIKAANAFETGTIFTLIGE